MRTIDVIGAGFSERPDHLQNRGHRRLQPRDVDRGRRSAARRQLHDHHLLAAADAGAADRRCRALLPTRCWRATARCCCRRAPARLAPPEVTFPPFHSGCAVQSITGIYGGNGTQLVRHSAYARAYALAQRLARHASTPYAFVRGVMRYLGSRLHLQREPAAEHATRSRPSCSTTRSATASSSPGRWRCCCGWAGCRRAWPPASRPARSTRGSHRYVVTDIDAHAWVEAWFPRYGWVRFDPTPGAAPARGGHVSLLPALKGPGDRSDAGQSRCASPSRRRRPAPLNATGTHGGGVAVADRDPDRRCALALVVLALRATARFSEPRADELLAELERALARSGRPARAAVSRSPRSSTATATRPEAVGYIRAIRMMRFGDGSGAADQRRSERRCARSCAPASDSPAGCARCGRCHRAGRPHRRASARGLNSA